MNRFQICTTTLLLAMGLIAAPASASTISVSLVTDNSTCNNGNDCFEDNSVFGTDRGVDWQVAGGTSSNIVGIGSASTVLDIDAVSGIDGGGDGSATGFLNFDLILTIDVDSPVFNWTVDLNQSVLGLYGLRGDGTASAVGTQSAGSAGIGPFNVTVDGNAYNFNAVNPSYSNNPSNNSSASQQFTGGRNDLGILAGTGDAIIAVNVDFDITSFTNDGCSGFICSSISGGEEAATLFGMENAMDQAVDDYSTWGRSITNDGYTGTFTLIVPEPTTATLIGLGLMALLAGGRRQD